MPNSPFQKTPLEWGLGGGPIPSGPTSPIKHLKRTPEKWGFGGGPVPGAEQGPFIESPAPPAPPGESLKQLTPEDLPPPPESVMPPEAMSVVPQVKNPKLKETLDKIKHGVEQRAKEKVKQEPRTFGDAAKAMSEVGDEFQKIADDPDPFLKQLGVKSDEAWKALKDEYGDQIPKDLGRWDKNKLLMRLGLAMMALGSGSRGKSMGLAGVAGAAGLSVLDQMDAEKQRMRGEWIKMRDQALQLAKYTGNQELAAKLKDEDMKVRKEIAEKNSLADINKAIFEHRNKIQEILTEARAKPETELQTMVEAAKGMGGSPEMGYAAYMKSKLGNKKESTASTEGKLSDIDKIISGVQRELTTGTADPNKPLTSMDLRSEYQDATSPEEKDRILRKAVRNVVPADKLPPQFRTNWQDYFTRMERNIKQAPAILKEAYTVLPPDQIDILKKRLYALYEAQQMGQKAKQAVQ